MNVVLYRKRGGHWAMTERRRKSLSRSHDHLQIGTSALQWDGDALTAHIEEITFPIPRRLRGNIRLTPQAIQPRKFLLDDAGRHRWQPIAPAARIEVDFTHPKLFWTGQAYFDTNDGDAPLGQDFSSWHWSRAATPAGATLLYDVNRRSGGNLCLGLNIGLDGVSLPFTPPPAAELPNTRWRVARETRADAGSKPKIVKTLEDTPFYARSIIASKINGQALTSVHESLSLERFSAPWVRMLLPFRMPRV